jgi:tetratricopeptide (TPR) repeat protein
MSALLLALLLAAPAAAAGAAAEAKAHYDAGRWEQAAAAFTAQAEAQPGEPAWHYGRGGALLKAGRLGPAVAAYERAFALAPRDRDVRENLDFALRRAGEELAPAGVPPALFALFTLGSERELAGLFWLAAWAALLLGAAALLRRAPPRAAFAAASLWLLLGLWWAGLRAALPPGRAVVTSGRAELRNGPGPGFTVGATVPEGRRVAVLSERDGWLEVGTLKEGERGWVEASAVERL